MIVFLLSIVLMIKTTLSSFSKDLLIQVIGFKTDSYKPTQEAANAFVDRVSNDSHLIILHGFDENPRSNQTICTMMDSQLHKQGFNFHLPITRDSSYKTNIWQACKPDYRKEMQYAWDNKISKTLKKVQQRFCFWSKQGMSIEEINTENTSPYSSEFSVASGLNIHAQTRKASYAFKMKLKDNTTKQFQEFYFSSIHMSPKRHGGNAMTDGIVKFWKNIKENFPHTPIIVAGDLNSRLVVDPTAKVILNDKEQPMEQLIWPKTFVSKSTQRSSGILLKKFGSTSELQEKLQYKEFRRVLLNFDQMLWKGLNSTLVYTDNDLDMEISSKPTGEFIQTNTRQDLLDINELFNWSHSWMIEQEKSNIPMFEYKRYIKNDEKIFKVDGRTASVDLEGWGISKKNINSDTIQDYFTFPPGEAEKKKFAGLEEDESMTSILKPECDVAQFGWLFKVGLYNAEFINFDTISEVVIFDHVPIIAQISIPHTDINQLQADTDVEETCDTSDSNQLQSDTDTEDTCDASDSQDNDYQIASISQEEAGKQTYKTIIPYIQEKKKSSIITTSATNLIGNDDIVANTTTTMHLEDRLKKAESEKDVAISNYHKLTGAYVSACFGPIPITETVSRSSKQVGQVQFEEEVEITVFADELVNGRLLRAQLASGGWVSVATANTNFLILKTWELRKAREDYEK